MRIVGIDGGQTGAAAALNLYDSAAPELIDLIDMPMIGAGAKERVDVTQVQAWIAGCKPDHVLVERAQGWPQQGHQFDIQARSHDRGYRSRGCIKRGPLVAGRANRLEEISPTRTG
jgi:hypothetical protein